MTDVAFFYYLIRKGGSMAWPFAIVDPSLADDIIKRLELLAILMELFMSMLRTFLQRLELKRGYLGCRSMGWV